MTAGPAPFNVWSAMASPPHDQPPSQRVADAERRAQERRGRQRERIRPLGWIMLVVILVTTVGGKLRMLTHVNIGRQQITDALTAWRTVASELTANPT